MVHNFQCVLLDTSVGTRKLCILGHLGLVFIWSCSVSCLLFLLFYVSLRNLCSGTCRKIRSPLFLFTLNTSPMFTSKRQRWYSLWRCTLYSVKPRPRRLAKTLWHGKPMVGKWVIWVHVQRDTFFALTGSKLFYQFRTRAFQNWRVIGQIACVTSVSRSCSNRCQSMNNFCVVIDWSSIDRYQLIPIN